MGLGSGRSSDSIWTAFDTQTTASVRLPIHNVKVAWNRIKDEGLDFAIVGVSVVNGIDIIQGQFSEITEPDKFQYFDESDRVVSLSYDRKMNEPLGSYSQARGEVEFENTSLRFTPNVSDTIGTSLKPNRPIKLFTGLKVLGQDKLIPAMYGLTTQPEENKASRITSVSLFDYISYIDDFELESSIYIDQRTDQIVEEILTDVGFVPAQFSLDEGLNTVGFAWFTKGQTAGERIRSLAESEEAHFYQDEGGVLRFENRRAFTDETSWTINKEDIEGWEEDQSVRIINRCFVEASPREIQGETEVWSSGSVVEVLGSSSVVIWAQFEDPVTSITTPVADTDYVGNSQSDGGGTDQTSDISIAVTTFTKTAKLTITNTNSSTTYLTLLSLRGTPATITSTISELYEDLSSQDTYGTYQVTITNDFIDTESFAYYLARAIVNKYKDPLKRVRISIRSRPQIQLKDRVSLEDQDLGTYSDYRVMRVEVNMTPNEFIQHLTLREITDFEKDSFAIVDISTVDGPDIVGI